MSTVPQFHPGQSLSPHAAWGSEIDVLPRIFEEGINIATMQRILPPSLKQSVLAQCHTNRAWQLAWRGEPDESLRTVLLKQLPILQAGETLVEDIRLLAEAMAYLFDADTVGIRLRLLHAAMCPRFHVDSLPVRLVTTYYGPGSEWLPESAVNRAGLGAPSAEKPDIVRNPGAIRQLAVGELALLKGSGWEDNEHFALVHRCPALAENHKRLLLTIDPA